MENKMITPDQEIALRERMSGDAFAINNGIVLDTVSLGYATAYFAVTPQHLNGGGVLQGGAIFTLADFAMAAAANSHGPLALSIQSDIRFLQSAGVGDIITATATETLLRRTVAHYTVAVTNQQNQLIATFAAVCHRKS